MGRIDAARAEQRIQQAAAIKAQQSHRGVVRIGQRSPLTGEHEAIYQDGGINPRGIKMFDAVHTPGDVVLAQPRTDGAVLLSDPSGRVPKPPGLGYLNGQIFNTPIGKPRRNNGIAFFRTFDSEIPGVSSNGLEIWSRFELPVHPDLNSAFPSANKPRRWWGRIAEQSIFGIWILSVASDYVQTPDGLPLLESLDNTSYAQQVYFGMKTLARYGQRFEVSFNLDQRNEDNDGSNYTIKIISYYDADFEADGREGYIRKLFVDAVDQPFADPEANPVLIARRTFNGPARAYFTVDGQSAGFLEGTP